MKKFLCLFILIMCGFCFTSIFYAEELNPNPHTDVLDEGEVEEIDQPRNPHTDVLDEGEAEEIDQPRNPHTDVLDEGEVEEIDQPRNPHTDVLDEGEYLFCYFDENKKKVCNTIIIDSLDTNVEDKCFDKEKTICYSYEKKELTLNNFKGYNLYIEECSSIKLIGENSIGYIETSEINSNKSSIISWYPEKLSFTGMGTLKITKNKGNAAISLVSIVESEIDKIQFANGIKVIPNNLTTKVESMDDDLKALLYLDDEIIINPKEEQKQEELNKEKQTQEEVKKEESKKEEQKPEESKKEATNKVKVCKVVDNKLYIYEGEEVTKNEYETTCGLLDNPHTGLKISLASFGIFCVTYLLIKRKVRKVPIYKI